MKLENMSWSPKCGKKGLEMSTRAGFENQDWWSGPRIGILLRERRSQEKRWSREEARSSRPAKMKAELVRPGREQKI